MIDQERNMEEQNNRIPRTLPVLHINNVVMFPHLLMPLVVTDEESRLVIDHALAHDKTMAFFLDREKTGPSDIGLNEIGTAVSILRMLRNQDGSISLLLQEHPAFACNAPCSVNPSSWWMWKPCTSKRLRTPRSMLSAPSPSS